MISVEMMNGFLTVISINFYPKFTELACPSIDGYNDDKENTKLKQYILRSYLYMICPRY